MAHRVPCDRGPTVFYLPICARHQPSLHILMTLAGTRTTPPLRFNVTVVTTTLFTHFSNAWYRGRRCSPEISRHHTMDTEPSTEHPSTTRVVRRRSKKPARRRSRTPKDFPILPPTARTQRPRLRLHTVRSRFQIPSRQHEVPSFLQSGLGPGMLQSIPRRRHDDS